MGKSDNIIKFEEALNNDSAKRKAYEEELIKNEANSKSVSDAMVKSAKAIGFDLTQEEVERCLAEKQEMADDELDKVAGGWCWIDDTCHTVINHHKEINEDDDCWNDYLCMVNEGSKPVHHDCTSTYNEYNWDDRKK